MPALTKPTDTRAGVSAGGRGGWGVSVLCLLLALVACAPAAPPVTAPQAAPASVHVPLLVDDLQERTFRYFWDLAGPGNGLIPDRWPTPSFSSVAAVGFGMTAYPVGIERGWITRDEGRARVLETLRFLKNAPEG